MSAPVSPRSFIILFLLSLFLFVIIQVKAITIVFGKLGLSAESAILLLYSSLFGSLINLPLFTLKRDEHIEEPTAMRMLFPGIKLPPLGDKVSIAINVGGGIIPITFSFYLMSIHSLSILQILMMIIMMSLISYLVGRPISGLGIGMPIFVAPITAALFALLINPEQAAPLAYIGGTLGVLIGADLMRLHNIRSMAVPIASIGGAGTFDGIFITGIIAVLLT